MNYWLIKTEPSTWSWEQQKKQKITAWDGVRNYQASNNLKSMCLHDLCFFYHSVTEKAIKGIVEVCKTNYLDPSDSTDRFGMVDVQYKEEFKNPVFLQHIKNHPLLQHLSLIKQTRLSVMPIDKKSWNIIFQLGM